MFFVRRDHEAFLLLRLPLGRRVLVRSPTSALLMTSRRTEGERRVAAARGRVDQENSSLVGVSVPEVGDLVHGLGVELHDWLLADGCMRRGWLPALSGVPPPVESTRVYRLAAAPVSTRHP